MSLSDVYSVMFRWHPAKHCFWKPSDRAFCTQKQVPRANPVASAKLPRVPHRIQTFDELPDDNVDNCNFAGTEILHFKFLTDTPHKNQVMFRAH